MQKACTCITVWISEESSPLFQSSVCRLKSLSARRVIRHNYRPEDLQVLRATVQNLDATATGTQALCSLTEVRLH